MFHERIQQLEKEVAAACLACYRERLVSVVLFGSMARGTARFDSDLDLLIVARALPAGRMQRMAEFECVEEALAPLLSKLQHDGIFTSVSPIFKTTTEADAGSPLFFDMVDDARILFDPEHFFSGLLQRLRARLAQLGAKRIWRGNSWHWDLKADYKPGEVFEL
jgi:uncharacterized protein